MILKRFVVIALCMVCGATTAQTPQSTLTIGGKPVEMAPIPGLTLAVDANQALTYGLAAADRRDWEGVRGYRAATTDPLVQNVLLWRLVTNASDSARFAELDTALGTLTDWPMRVTMRQRAEARIETQSGLSPQGMVDWLTKPMPGLGDSVPLTGEGKVALASALQVLGRTSEALPIIRQTWRTATLNSDVQSRVLARFGSALSPEDHAARVDLLLWANRITQARPLLTLLSARDKDMATHRLGLSLGQSTILDAEIQNQPAILYERVRRLRQGGNNAAALDLLQKIDSRGLPETAWEPLFIERRTLLIEALRTRNWQAAYNIASAHGYSRGERFADGEFLAGWIALRFLKNNADAERHFTTLANGVATAVSRSRGYYWQGRAAEARGNKDLAVERYRQAAQFPTTYYGQLAAVAADPDAKLVLPDVIRATDADRKAFGELDLVKVIGLLYQARQTDLARQFTLHLDDLLKTEGQHQLLSEMARAQGDPATAVRTAKTGISRGVIATDAAFPLVQIPRLVGYGQIEDAYTLAIARQESEFNPMARSHAGAVGLMQFLPSTASMQARRMGLEFSSSRLSYDQTYALTLGSAHLYDLTNQFDGSYILAAVAYNAGPGRANQWIAAYGDPRVDVMDPIDWVEMIPIAETRNYVQRVLENIQVYRTRLAGSPQPIQIERDLKRGRRPY
jgi:soluble lytic murein transglycosylase